MNSQIECFRLNPGGSVLAAKDSSGMVNVWDTGSHELNFSIDLTSMEYRDMEFLNDDSLLLLTADKAECVDSKTGSRLWVYRDSGIFSSDGIRDVASGSVGLSVYSDAAYIMLDIDTGDLIRRIEMPDSDLANFASYSGYVLSPSGTKLAFALIDDVYTSYPGVYDISTGEFNIVRESEGMISSLAWTDDDHLVIASDSDYSDDSSRYVDSYVLTADIAKITCYDVSDMSVIWRTDFESSGVAVTSGFMYIPVRDEILYYSGNRCNTYSALEGELSCSWSTGESIVDVSDRTGDGWPLIITEGGGLSYPTTRQALHFSREFISDITAAAINKGVYTLALYGSDIVYFNTYVSDGDWVELSDDFTAEYVSGSCMADHCLAVISKDEAVRLTLIDPVENEIIRSVDLGGGDFLAADYKIIGITEDEALVTYSSIQGTVLIEVDISSGRTDETTLTGRYISGGLAAGFYDGMTVYFSGDSNEIGLLDPDTGRSSIYEVPVSPNLNMRPFYSDENEMIYVSSDEGDYVVDVSEDEYERVALPSGWSGTSNISVSGEGRIAVSDGSEIMMLDEDLDPELTINLSGHSPLGFTFMDDPEASILLVMFSDGTLTEYDALSGEFISSTEVSCYSNYFPQAEFDIDSDNGILYVTMGNLLDMVDLDSMVETAYITECLGYNHTSDRFYTMSYTSSDERHIGYFRHYTLEDLIDKADGILSGTQMPQEMRSRYGL